MRIISGIVALLYVGWIVDLAGGLLGLWQSTPTSNASVLCLCVLGLCQLIRMTFD